MKTEQELIYLRDQILWILIHGNIKLYSHQRRMYLKEYNVLKEILEN